MTRYKILFILILLLATLTLIGLHFSQSPEGPHGGEVKQAGTYNIEVKTVSSYFFSYLLDSNAQPIGNKGISCNVRFIYSNHDDYTVSLTPYEGDGFFVKLVMPQYNLSQVSFIVKGNTIMAQFENESLIAKNK